MSGIPEYPLLEVRVAAVPRQNGQIENVDVIEFAGTPWLVLLWHDWPDGETSSPIRLVCLSLLQHDKGAGLHDYIVRDHLPETLWDPTKKPEGFPGVLVLDIPALKSAKTRSAN